MSSRLETLVAYLAGGEGPAVEQIRFALEDPAGGESQFLEETRRRTRSLFDDEVLGILGLPPDPVPAPPPAVPPAPPAPRTWPRVIPWLISAAACVLLGLFWQDYRQRQDDLEETLRSLEERRPAEAVPPPRRQDEPDRLAEVRKAVRQAVREALPKGGPAPPDARLDRVKEGLADLTEQVGDLAKRIDKLPRPAAQPDPQLVALQKRLTALGKQVSSLTALVEKRLTPAARPSRVSLEDQLLLDVLLRAAQDRTQPKNQEEAVRLIRRLHADAARGVSTSATFKGASPQDVQWVHYFLQKYNSFNRPQTTQRLLKLLPPAKKNTRPPSKK
jgi:hypothetical protein